MNMNYWNNLTLEQREKVKSYLNEIERLNNIINELQKWLSDLCLDPHCCFEYRIVLNKLKELRGEDK